jgi:hypothetical protein
MYQNIKILKRLIISCISIGMSTSIYASKPVWEFSAPIPANATVYANRTATIIYTVTNNSLRSKNLVLRATPGVSASSCSLAGKGSSCTLTLTIDGNTIPAQGIHAGPILCEQANSLQCYQPAAKNQLNVSKSVLPTTSLSTNPTSVHLIQGDSSATSIIITNTGVADAYDLNAIIGTPNLDVSISSTTCSAVLPHTPPGNTCQIDLLPGTLTGTTSLNISASNTNTVNTPITISLPPTTLSTNPTSVTLMQGGSSSTVILTNDGAADANNVSVTINSPNLGASISNNTCPTVLPHTSPNNTCQFDVVSSVSTGTTNITISASNAPTIIEPLTITTAPPTTLTIPARAVIPVADSNGVSVTVNNIGIYPAINVHVDLSGTGWTDVESTTCEVIDAGSSCNLIITSNSPYLAQGNIPIAGDNLSSPPTMALAFRYQGGLVFDKQTDTPVTGQTTVKMMTETSITTAAWGGDGFEVGGVDQNSVDGVNSCDGKVDGACNTQRIINCLTNGVNCTSTPPSSAENTYAAGTCNQYTGGAYNDWYLPAICELGIYTGGGADPSCGTTIPNIFNNLYQLGFGSLSSSPFYWSSTEFASSPTTYSWVIYYQSSISTNTSGGNKFNIGDIRCVRKATY